MEYQEQEVCRIESKLLLLSYFIPWPLKAVLEVDAIGEHGKGGGLEEQSLTVGLDVFWPVENTTLKTLGDDPIARSVEIQNLDKVAPFVGEEEGGSAGGIDLDLRAGNFGETVEALAHVGGLEGDVDFEVSVESEHDRVQARALIKVASRATEEASCA